MYLRTQRRTQAMRRNAHSGQSAESAVANTATTYDSNSSLIAITSLLIPIISYCEQPALKYSDTVLNNGDRDMTTCDIVGTNG